jgi:hypothetical protein
MSTIRRIRWRAAETNGSRAISATGAFLNGTLREPCHGRCLDTVHQLLGTEQVLPSAQTDTTKLASGARRVHCPAPSQFNDRKTDPASPIRAACDGPGPLVGLGLVRADDDSPRPGGT